MNEIDIYVLAIMVPFATLWLIYMVKKMFNPKHANKTKPEWNKWY